MTKRQIRRCRMRIRGNYQKLEQLAKQAKVDLKPLREIHQDTIRLERSRRY